VPYLFIDRYCKVLANIPERGIVTLTGWITFADEQSILLTDENNNHIQIYREQLIGSILVLEEQKPKVDAVRCAVRQLADSASQ
jgi:hypothetical protein